MPPPSHYLNISSAGYVYTPSISAYEPGANTFDLRAYVSMASFTPGGFETIMGKWGSSGQTYRFFIDATGHLWTSWKTGVGGATQVDATSTVAVGAANNASIWVRALADPTAGTVTFYTSLDGSAWTQLGATVSGLVTGAVTTASVSQDIVVGQESGGANQFVGKIYETLLQVNGVTVANATFSAQATSTTSFTDPQARSWTVGGGAAIA
jgi:hypothetical protein